MGFVDALFGKKAVHPPLDPASAAAARIAARGELLDEFVRRVQVRLELVPAADTVYVFLDKPPGVFGLAWFENDREVNFTSLKEEQGLSQGRIQLLSKKLGAAYRKHGGETRYATTIAGREVLVTPSATLAAEIRQAIDDAVS
ncbi:MAG TPA: hypothetical protein VN317_04330 [Candidatus Methanoperedens sp.]|nr:hypothetical protein [Candidatus Methanoperedens sp.]